ncbi:sulfite reductase (NADPH) hemoprotein beta-component [Blastomyces parvus]|uniref:Sulfite reductase (NADPH) hemoprotein beta-component n=1 Tax=Blastomyces parvus TaxID=2060905 RepID=A0A2B7XEE0_9EURO|nr:sulfite reductase (NADPH) hemoprotein beta-component [Blastomyces parvus]
MSCKSTVIASLTPRLYKNEDEIPTATPNLAPEPAPGPAATSGSQDTTNPPTADPVIASYDIYITDSQIRRFLFQYPDRQATQPYNAATQQKPTELRIKPRTGLVEVDIPINTHINYDEKKGLRYGNALKKSSVIAEGGSMGMAGGFNTGGRAKGAVGAGAGAIGVDDGEDGMAMMGKRRQQIFAGDEEGLMDYEDEKAGVIMTTQTLGGRIKEPVDGDPVYMLGAFRENELHLAPLSAVVQLRPQLHHLDAFDEVSVRSKAMTKGKRDADDEGGPRAVQQEARAIDMKVKSADVETGKIASNNVLLRRMHEEKWEKYAWIDENDQDSWDKYEEYMFNQSLDEPPLLQSAIGSEDYVDGMSAPRIDPINPEMAGWAMKLRRKAQRPSDVRGTEAGD